MKKFVVLGLLMIFGISSIFSAGSIEAANRKTAVRCLKLSESFLQTGDFQNAMNQAELGLAYDESISDLWYIKAASLNLMGEPKANVLPLVIKAMTEGQWVDYNRDGARILYADLLCETGEYDQALTVLDDNPFILSSDAEFIRVKCYYRLKTQEGIIKAREKVNSARKIYSLDIRFPSVFFKHEYWLKNYEVVLTEESDLLRNKIAESFVNKMPEYDNPDAELEVYACFFAEGERKKRLLQAFSSHNMEHPLYARLALEEGLMNQQEAWDYFCKFADEAIELEFLEDFLPLVTDEDTKASVIEHLNVYSGELYVDVNEDFEPELFVKYLRGRPVSFYCDRNNDGIIDFDVKCDFGVPEVLNLTQGNLEIVYGTYPSIVKVTYKSEVNKSGSAVFYVPDDSFKWTVCQINALPSVKNLFDFDFYVPDLESEQQFDDRKLVFYSSAYEIPTQERENSYIRFTMKNGLPESSDYYENNILYAHGLFKNGEPVLRAVDNNGDGIFETKEIYGFDGDAKMHTSVVDQAQLMTNLFGLPAFGSGLYVKMIQIDQNGDTVPDFTEEYLSDGGKISSWDLDGDGNWDIRYKKYPKENESDPLIEDSDFYIMPEHKLVTVTLWNDEPVKVHTDSEDFIVTQGKVKGFYWVGQAGNEDDEAFVLENFDPEAVQGLSVLLSNEKKRMIVVKVGENIYVQISDNPEKSDN